tara:strand:- start:316 stop:825 length:510 start_codon:yes stop_codon:yes gene_type:complete
LELKKYITNYKDFPKKGIIFRDVLAILQEPDIFNELILNMSKADLFRNADAIVSIDARGFLFGAAISLKTSKPLIVARKIGKLPGELVTRSYELEYGKNTLCIQKKSVEKYNSFAIVDDLLATGGTVKCVFEILKILEKDVTGLSVVIELEELKGRMKLPFKTDSQLII